MIQHFSVRLEVVLGVHGLRTGVVQEIPFDIRVASLASEPRRFAGLQRQVLRALGQNRQLGLVGCAMDRKKKKTRLYGKFTSGGVVVACRVTVNVHRELVLDRAEIVFHLARVIARVRQLHSTQRVVEGRVALFEQQHVVFTPRKQYRRRT